MFISEHTRAVRIRRNAPDLRIKPATALPGHYGNDIALIDLSELALLDPALNEQSLCSGQRQKRASVRRRRCRISHNLHHAVHAGGDNAAFHCSLSLSDLDLRFPQIQFEAFEFISLLPLGLFQFLAGVGEVISCQKRGSAALVASVSRSFRGRRSRRSACFRGILGLTAFIFAALRGVLAGAGLRFPTCTGIFRGILIFIFTIFGVFTLTAAAALITAPALILIAVPIVRTVFGSGSALPAVRVRSTRRICLVRLGRGFLCFRLLF